MAFDPKKHPAEKTGFDAAGNMVRGLKMPRDRFRFMTVDMKPMFRVEIRKVVDEHEAAGDREYDIHYPGGWYRIENGIPCGNGRF